MLNKVMLIGNLGADPETRTFPNGGTVTSLRVATSESWKDKQTGERKERTEWHRVELFNRLGEIAAQYLHKGSKVYLEGSIRTDKWQDQSGQDRYSTKIVAREMKMLDARGSGNGGGQGQQGGDGTAPIQNRNPQPQAQPQGIPQGQPPVPGARMPQGNPGQAMPPSHGQNDFDDDIPF